jgi:hypothetical protein
MHTHLCMYSYMYKCVRTGVCTHMRMCVCVCARVCVYNYVRVYVRTYVGARVYDYVRTYVRMYACMYARMHVCMYVCMYVCINAGLPQKVDLRICGLSLRSIYWSYVRGMHIHVYHRPRTFSLVILLGF